VAILEEIGDVDAVQEVADAYNAIRDVDVLDTSETGTEIWVQAELHYTERTSRVENSIIARLRDRLATAKTANEMFRVFSKFNALLVRPKVRGAIGEYQTQLLDNVKNDIAALHERYKQQYGGSETQMMSQLRDIPPVAGSILWVRQIEAQLNNYMKKVEAVLGQDWTLHTDGEKLHAESEMFRKKLTTRPIYEAWLADVQRRNLQISGRLFSIVRARGASGALELGVNFDNHVISLFKEVRNLTWLNFQIPHAISNVSKEAQRVYPFALSLMESVTTYLSISRTIATMPDVSKLLTGYERDVQTLFAKGTPLRWESFVHIYDMPSSKSIENGAASVVRSDSKHVQYVRDLSAAVAILQTKTWTLQQISKNINLALTEIKTCNYNLKIFEAQVDAIQNGVDKLNLENYANLNAWVSTLNNELRSILQERLSAALEHWTRSFSDLSQPGNTDASLQEDNTYTLSFPHTEIGILMNNQTIFIEPPLNYVKASWLANLEEFLHVV
jgi:dynein heavy chain 1, cytosolic